MCLALNEALWHAQACAIIGALMSLETVYYLSQLIVAVVVVATLIAIWLPIASDQPDSQGRTYTRVLEECRSKPAEMVDTPEKTEFVHLILWEPRKPTHVKCSVNMAF